MRYPFKVSAWQDKARKTCIKIKEIMKMSKYECPCGYIYDPEEGDIEHGVQPGTAFEDLPDEWVCPWCEAEKQYFEKMDD